VLGFLIIR